ncbi:hypothetical protein [Streptomyces sp. cg35]|uniref:hypothetical protein n=1 Tax=Streptomyces sp. cg35 TaxID=3421650 RepID=UPI003D16719B
MGEREERLLRALACAALDRELDGVLLFDAEPQVFAEAARRAAELLALADGQPPRTVALGASTREDELWLNVELRVENGSVGVSTRPGPLVDLPDAARRLVLVPDLTRLSLAGTRAAIQVLGAASAHVERYGHTHRWQPRARWIAACRRDEAGRISPHLLDRFPIRIDAADLSSAPDPARRFASARGDDRPDATSLPVPHRWTEILTRSEATRPGLTEEAVRRVTDLVDAAVGNRRALALARTGRALAALDGAEAADAAHMDAAARLLGLLTAPARRPPERDEPESDRPARRQTPSPATGRPPATSHGQEVAAVPPEPAEPLTAFELDDEGQPSGHPEDEPDPLRAPDSLRVPPRRHPGTAPARGPVVGVRRATGLRDLAFIPTAMEAAKYRQLPERRPSDEGTPPGHLVVTPADLRSYARSPEPELMLALLLDHTCRKGWAWESTLAPYLQWAYAGRASLGVVELGHEEAVSELRAEAFTTRNVLDPRVSTALSRTAGRGTPLAHGLLLVQQLLRRSFQHQRSGLAEAWLVVVTDGRGNVPMSASGADRVAGPVGRTGVDDALTVARQIGALDRMRLRTVVVDPVVRPYGDLPFALAQALGGEVVAGREELVTGDVEH